MRILNKLSSSESQKREQQKEVNSYIKDISVDNRAMRHFEAWTILKYLGYNFIGAPLNVSADNIKQKIEHIARMDIKKIQYYAMLFNINAFIPAKNNTNISKDVRDRALNFIRDIISSMYGLSLKSSGYKDNVKWFISHNPLLTELAVGKVDKPTQMTLSSEDLKIEEIEINNLPFR